MKHLSLTFLPVSKPYANRYSLVFMLFNTTFNNIIVISWLSVLLVEETRENHRKEQVTDKLYHIMLYTSPWSRFKLTTTVVIGTDCLGSCKSNYHTITAMTAPQIGFNLETWHVIFYIYRTILSWNSSFSLYHPGSLDIKYVFNTCCFDTVTERFYVIGLYFLKFIFNKSHWFN